VAEIKPYEKRMDDVRSLLSSSKPQILMALPKHMNADRLLRIAMTSIARNPKILDCTPNSLIGAIIQCAQLGLEPDDMRGTAYLVPFFNTKKQRLEIQLIPGYVGLMDLARRSRMVSTIEARAVYAKDVFEFEFGLSPRLKHIPAGQMEVQEITYFYSIGRLRDGGVHVEILTREQVERIRDRFSKAKDAGPWVTDFEAMGKKTVVRRLAKYLPASPELQAAVALDEIAEIGIPQELGEFLPPEDAGGGGGKLDRLAKDIRGGTTEEPKAPTGEGPPLQPFPKEKEGPPTAETPQQRLV
jgi:recombination protein RecT